MLLTLISMGGCPRRVTVPDVLGITQAGAEAAIVNAGLTVGSVTEEYSDTVAEGLVISQSPAAGTKVARGSAVALVVSKGPEARIVPDVVGLAQAAAEAAIISAGLSVGAVTEAYSATVPAGNVISQSPTAGSSVPAGTAVALVVSKGLPIVPNVVGLAQAAAEAAIISAGLSVGVVTEAFSATVAAGLVISQNPAAGSSAAAGSGVDLVVSKGPFTVSGRVLFDDGGPVAGAAVLGSVIAEEMLSALRQAAVQRMFATDWSRPEFKSNPLLMQVLQQLPLPLLQPLQEQSATTDENGNFTFGLDIDALPVKVLVEVSFQPEGLPAVQTAKWTTAEAGPADMGTIIIPNPADREMTVTNGTSVSDDGSIQVDGLPPEVDRLFGAAYDPDENPEAFPGEFAEMGNIPLNSTVFLWMEAFDAAGNPVHDLSHAVTIRSRIPFTQWIDLEDISNGTDRIEIPIYTYNEAINMWEQEGIGWVEDGSRTVLPEDAEPSILDGTFPGDLYAAFTTNHFSWMNVDYAYIGPWTLSRLDPAMRNSDCLFEALQLAKTIAKSAAGRAAYAKFNTPDGDLDVELADAAGPELKNGDIGNSYGEFKGNEQGDRDDQFYVSNNVWNGCGDGATADQKKNTTLLMAITILHETAHWKWDVKHDGGKWTNAEPGGEAGNELEKDLFGGIITNGNGIKRDGSAVDNATRDGWLNPASWPPPGGKAGLAQAPATPQQEISPLELTIALGQTAFELGEEIPVTVTHRNVSTQSIRVLDQIALEGYPLWFEIVRDGATERVPFGGSRAKRGIDYDADFVTLQPEESLNTVVTLLRDDLGKSRYNLIASGDYQVTAYYSGHWGLPETASNTLAFNVGAGGSISGLITNAASGLPIPGATVKVLQGANILTTVTSDAVGLYLVPELPGGAFTLEAQAAGFLRSRQENVVVTVGANTVVNFSLSALLALGEMRLVLTWGQTPSDLDSHLWLPIEMPYHVYFGLRGSLEACPFAALDTDDTTGFGPETITIRQRRLEGTYIYAVHNFSGFPSLAESGAQVQVFDSTGLIATINVPTEGEGIMWHVLEIDGLTGGITEINEIGGYTEPYPSTDNGCAVE